MQLIKSKKIVGVLALAGTMALTGIVGFAQQGTTRGAHDGKGHAARRDGRRGDHSRGERGMRGGFAGRFAGKLNLSDAQKEQMRQISARYRESAKAQRHNAQRADRLNEFNDGAFDEAAVRAAAQARANARVEMEVQRARMMSEMYAVLTPEQKMQLVTERQQWEQKRQERRTRRNANATPNQ